MKTARTYRRNSSNNNDEDDKHGKSRQQLPRRCKSIQPFYAIDMANEEDDHIIPTNKRKRGNGSSSSMTKKALVQQPRQKKLPVEANPVTVTVTVTVTEKEAENKELMTSAITVLSWLIDMKVLRENSLLYCIKELNEKPIGRGLVTRQGVACCCCEKIIPLLKFPHHRGVLTDRPYEKIFVVDAGVSLLTCIIEAWNRHSVPARSGYHHVEKRVNVNDDYDDCCAICADGGELICCENCPSTYHPDCVGFKGVPKDDWHCPYSHCKACVADNPGDLLLTCFQCLKKYHWQCSDLILDRILRRGHQPSIPFCGKRCWMVYRTLEEKVGRSMPITNQLSWIIVRRMDLDIDGVNTEKLYLKAKCNTMVVLAAKVMEESFKLIVDRQTRANMVESVVYNCGSNFTRTNFSRFYTAILEFEGQVVSVASFRLPSPKIAEIPFIATTEAWRNKGMCKLLLAAIETALAEMGAEHMVIPSAEELVENWQKKFRFKPLDEAMKREIIELNTLMFPRTTRLQKEVKPQKLEVLVKRLEMKRQREEIKAQKLKIKAQNQQLKEEIKAQKKVRAPRRVQQKIQVPVRIMLPDLNLPATE